MGSSLGVLRDWVLVGSIVVRLVGIVVLALSMNNTLCIFWMMLSLFSKVSFVDTVSFSTEIVDVFYFCAIFTISRDFPASQFIPDWHACCNQLVSSER